MNLRLHQSVFVFPIKFTFEVLIAHMSKWTYHFGVAVFSIATKAII